MFYIKEPLSFLALFNCFTICQAGLSVLAKYRRPIVVHAEIQQDFENHLELNEDNLDPRAYLTYLNARPPSW